MNSHHNGDRDMTTIVTLSCPEGIVMGADSRIRDKVTNQITDDVLKIIKVENFDIAISYWGEAPVGNKFLDILKEFQQNLCEDETVDSITEKLRLYLEQKFPDYDNKEMGFHIAGMILENGSNKPRIKHVFHVSWCEKGKFINENSNQEYHKGPIKLTYECERKYIPLFNGENSIANGFFNLIPQAFGDRQILLEKFNIEMCERLANLIITVNDSVLEFYYSIDQQPRQANRVTGGEPVIIAITRDGFRDLKRYELLKSKYNGQ